MKPKISPLTLKLYEAGMKVYNAYERLCSQTVYMNAHFRPLHLQLKRVELLKQLDIGFNKSADVSYQGAIKVHMDKVEELLGHSTFIYQDVERLPMDIWTLTFDDGMVIELAYEGKDDYCKVFSTNEDKVEAMRRGMVLLDAERW